MLFQQKEMNPFQPNQIQMADDDPIPIDNDNNHCERLSLQENDSMFYGFNVNQTLLNEQCSAGSSGPNAPPPSSCGTTTSDHSVNQSPGPIKRFRQIYGGGETTHSSPQSTFTNKQRTPTMNWTENWMNTHYLYSKPSTSSTPSIISNGSAISQLSNLSVDTQLSVAVDFLNLELNLPQINEVTNTSSSIENVDPCHFQQIKQCLAQILNKLTSIDEIQEFDGLRQLYKIAKDRQFIYCIEPTQISQIIQRLIEIVLRPNTKQRTKTLTMNLLSKITMAGNVCLNAIRSLETANRGIFLNAVIICLRPDSEEDDARFATNILSTLFTHPIVGEFFRRQARSQTIIRELMLALRQENYGFRHKFLRQIYHLIKPSRELKRFFHQSNGMQICLDLFEKAVDEPMLHGCVALISLLIEGIEPALSQIPMDHFVRLKGIQILSTRLDHGSPRLLQCIARCLALASDSNEIANQEIDHALRLSVQLIASTEGEMVKHLVGFIANVQSKHPAAKIFLQQNNAIPNLMFLLAVWVNSSPSLPSATGHENEEKWKYLSVQRKGIDDLIDTILLALNNLSNGLNADANISCLAIMEHKNAPSLFFQLLASSNRPEIIQIRTLYLLWRIFITLRHSIVDQFVNTSIREQQEEPKGYVHILLELFFGAIQRIYSSNGQKNENQQTTRKLASRSLLVLNEFVKYSPFLGQAASLIRASNWNLFALLRSLRDEELEIQFIEFLYHLSASSDLLAQWMFFYGDIINFTSIPHLSNYAVKIFNRFHHHNNNNASNIKL